MTVILLKEKRRQVQPYTMILTGKQELSNKNYQTRTIKQELSITIIVIQDCQ